jgi:hypothetical protein
MVERREELKEVKIGRIRYATIVVRSYSSYPQEGAAWLLSTCKPPCMYPTLRGACF